jgi:hypothetical protein
VADKHAADFERPARFRVHDEVDVAHAVLKLPVCQPVILLGKRAQGLSKHNNRFAVDGYLAHLCPEDKTRRANNVANIVFPDVGEGFLTDVV